MGEFALFVHEVAEWDPRREDEVMDWPLRDILQAAYQRRRREALRSWELENVVWAAFAAQGGKKVKPPELPEILKD